jgi:hypothetical protein
MLNFHDLHVMVRHDGWSHMIVIYSACVPNFM